MSLLRTISGLRQPRQALAVLCLLNVVLMTTGLPVYQPNGKDHSQPFICMDSRCGCMTAEQCWRQCCCHTMEEKLAWAKEHDIPVPEYVLDQVAAAHEKEAVEDSCCDSCEQAKKCSCEQTQDTSCCSHSTAGEGSKHRLTWLATLQALKCQGYDGWSLLNNLIVVDPTQDEAISITLPSSEYVLQFSDALVSVPAIPDTPPPRFVA